MSNASVNNREQKFNILKEKVMDNNYNKGI